MLSDLDQQRLGDLRERLGVLARTQLGFPIWANPDAARAARPFLDLVLNNLGDPFRGGSCRAETFELEREVVRYLATLWGLKDAEPWGYVCSGGSEANLAGLWLAREGLPPGAVVYASTAAHYSARKAARILNMDLRLVEAHGDSIDLGSLAHRLDPHRPAALFLTAGTTKSGAVDDVAGACRTVQRSGVPFLVHVDAALSGLLLPFLDDAPKFAFDAHPAVASVSVSCHKMPGSPVPGAAFVTRARPVGRSVEYIGSEDATVGGSRSGLAAVCFWAALRSLGRDGLERQARQCVSLAEGLRDVLRVRGLRAELLPWSTTVVIDRPAEAVCKRWQLACFGELAHVVVMPSTTTDLLAEFASDLGWGAS